MRYLFVILFGLGAMVYLGGCGLEWKDHRAEEEASLRRYNATAKPQDRIVCSIEAQTGTLIRKRVCRRVGDVNLIRGITQNKLIELGMRGSEKRP